MTKPKKPVARVKHRNSDSPNKTMLERIMARPGSPDGYPGVKTYSCPECSSDLVACLAKGPSFTLVVQCPRCDGGR